MPQLHIWPSYGHGVDKCTKEGSRFLSSTASKKCASALICEIRHNKDFAQMMKLKMLQKLSLCGNKSLNMKDCMCLSELCRLKTLVLKINSLESLDGIQNCYALEAICIDRTNVKTLESLSGLSKLTQLSIVSCKKLHSIEPLVKTNITNLDCSQTALGTLGANNLPASLIKLRADICQIRDLNIQSMPHLSFLSIQSTSRIATTPNAGHKYQVDVGTCPMLTQILLGDTNVSVLCTGRNESLRMMHLNYNRRVRELNILYHTPNVEEIFMCGLAIERLQFNPQTFETLTRIHLDESIISDIGALRHCKTLEYFSARSCKNLTDISNLPMARMRQLYIQLSNVEILPSIEIFKTETEALPLLELNMDDTCIKDMSIVNFLPYGNLINLSMSHLPFQDVGHISHLTNLKYLNLSWTSIRSIDGIQNLTSLSVLNIDHTEIETLQPLATCSELIELYLRYCIRIGTGEFQHIPKSLQMLYLEASHANKNFVHTEGTIIAYL